MPPKIRLHKSSGKHRIQLNKIEMPSTSSDSTNSTSNDINSQEVQQQFEVELYWCIQQLEDNLKAVKNDPRRAQSITKSLNILKSSTTSMIAKRQTMRSCFGDYRAKMLEEERKLARANNQIKFKTKPSTSKYVFVKKSAFLNSNSNFKFNFPTPKENSLENDIKKLELSEKEVLTFQFQPSNNEFRFNFDNSDENKRE